VSYVDHTNYSKNLLLSSSLSSKRRLQLRILDLSSTETLLAALTAVSSEASVDVAELVTVRVAAFSDVLAAALTAAFSVALLVFRT
jgi:hypothetical protein